MFHKESKCSKQRGPSINLKFRSKTLQLEKQRECHLFFASMSTSREAPIYNLANGGQREKRALEVGTPHSLSHYPSTEPEGTRSRLQLLTEV